MPFAFAELRDLNCASIISWASFSNSRRSASGEPFGLSPSTSPVAGPPGLEMLRHCHRNATRIRS